MVFIMKINNKTLILISISIILGASIISYAILNKPMTAAEHCYYKLYKNKLTEGATEAQAAYFAKTSCLE